MSDISVPEPVNEDRDFDNATSVAEKSLKAAAPKYRLIIALAGYGGLSSPSELAGAARKSLLWADDRFIVHGPKTGRCGKEMRVATVVAEWLPCLLEVQEAAPEKEDRAVRNIDEESSPRDSADSHLGRNH